MLFKVEPNAGFFSKERGERSPPSPLYSLTEKEGTACALPGGARRPTAS